MDPASTGPHGAHALVTLLRDRGVTVEVAASVADGKTQRAREHCCCSPRASASPAIRCFSGWPLRQAIGCWWSRPRALAPRSPPASAGGASVLDTKPNCALREADRAGSVDFGPSNTFRAVGGRAVTSCYGGALVRYRDGERTVTVVGSTDFMTNGGLLQAGNAALAMNLAGQHPRLVWYAPQRVEDQSSGSTTIFGLIPANVIWMVVQLWLAVLLIALWKGRRIGPLVAEDLPVVVRASEAVEGRGRLYRSRRARDRAAQALRAATLQRLVPRLGLGADTSAPAIVIAVAQRSRSHEESVRHILFGPSPVSDADLVQLARALDDIERQFAQT